MFNNVSNDEDLHPNAGEELENGMQEYNLEHITRLGFPITLDPETSTLDDIGIHAKLRQGYSYSTIQHNLTYANMMANHNCPVQLFPPDYNNFVRHIDYRIEIENAGPHALRHEIKVINMINRAYGNPEFKVRLPTPPKSHIRILPFPETVRKFFKYKYTDDKDENIALQYLFFHGFLLGIRPPSELCSLTTDHIILDNEPGYIIITETKKHRTQRIMIPEHEILTDYRHKSIKNWLDKWRPRFETQHSKNHLYIQPSTGKPYSLRHLGHKLSKHGKKVWRHFQPYDMRHWSCTARLIQQKAENNVFDVYPVKQHHGHEKIQTTMNYLRYAEQYYRQAPYDWIKRALKWFNNWPEESALKSIKGQKTLVSSGNPSRDLYGPGRTRTGQQKRNKSINITFWVLSKFQPLTKKFSFLFSFGCGSFLFSIKNYLKAGARSMSRFLSSINPSSHLSFPSDCWKRAKGKNEDKKSCLFTGPAFHKISLLCVNLRNAVVNRTSACFFASHPFLLSSIYKSLRPWRVYAKKLFSSITTPLKNTIYTITYNHVCHKLYKGLLKLKSLTTTKLTWDNVMLCNIHLSFLYYVSSLSIVILFKLFYVTNVCYVNRVCYVISRRGCL